MNIPVFQPSVQCSGRAVRYSWTSLFLKPCNENACNKTVIKDFLLATARAACFFVKTPGVVGVLFQTFPKSFPNWPMLSIFCPFPGRRHTILIPVPQSHDFRRWFLVLWLQSCLCSRVNLIKWMKEAYHTRVLIELSYCSCSRVVTGLFLIGSCCAEFGAQCGTLEGFCWRMALALRNRILNE